MIKQFLELYILQTPVDFKYIAIAMSNKNKADIAQYAHHIKPTMEYIGASDIRANFQELETLAKSDAPLIELENSFNTIDSQFRHLMSELESYLDSLS